LHSALPPIRTPFPMISLVAMSCSFSRSNFLFLFIWTGFILIRDPPHRSCDIFLPNSFFYSLHLDRASQTPCRPPRLVYSSCTIFFSDRCFGSLAFRPRAFPFLRFPSAEITNFSFGVPSLGVFVFLRPFAFVKRSLGSTCHTLLSPDQRSRQPSGGPAPRVSLFLVP